MSKILNSNFISTSPLGSYLAYELQFPLLENEINNIKVAEFQKLRDCLTPDVLFLSSQMGCFLRERVLSLSLSGQQKHKH